MNVNRVVIRLRYARDLAHDADQRNPGLTTKALLVALGILATVFAVGWLADYAKSTAFVVGQTYTVAKTDGLCKDVADLPVYLEKNVPPTPHQNELAKSGACSTLTPGDRVVMLEKNSVLVKVHHQDARGFIDGWTHAVSMANEWVPYVPAVSVWNSPVRFLVHELSGVAGARAPVANRVCGAAKALQRSEPQLHHTDCICGVGEARQLTARRREA